MNLAQIKKAVDAGKTVYWSSTAYTVIRDSTGHYLIAFDRDGRNANFIGLTHQDGTTMNGEERDFFTNWKTYVATAIGTDPKFRTYGQNSACKWAAGAAR
jgi:hypothetical protein